MKTVHAPPLTRPHARPLAGRRADFRPALRAWIVLLLAVLLPLRGMAVSFGGCESAQLVRSSFAAMPCHAGHGGHAGPAAGPSQALHAAVDEAGTAPQDGASLPPPAGPHPDSHPACAACAVGCHAALPAMSTPQLEPPVLLSDAAFPAYLAPSPRFHQEAQERPPRLA